MKGFLNRRILPRAFQSDERGSAFVELALALPMLSIILLGAAEFARLAYAAIEVTNAAHAAAVYAATSVANVTFDSGGNPQITTGMSNAASADSPNLVGGNAVSVTAVQTTCQCTDGTSVACTDSSTCQGKSTGMITTVTITTRSTFSPLISLPRWKPTFTLQGKSSQVMENQ
ncbi:MAG TPA: TadE/TadG family type IV pilus assembly protein [Terracidiphilus sp.]|jgi:Flp pilus assembly protein TadG